MTKKQQITYGIIAGTIFLMALFIMSISIDCPTSFQNIMFKTLLALSGASFASVIPGFINVSYKGIITAGGALGIFVIIYFFTPATLSDFKSCPSNSELTGIIFIDNVPSDNIEVRFLNTDQIDETNSFGKFNFSFDESAIEEKLQLHLISNVRDIDTIIIIPKDKMSSSVEIRLNDNSKADTKEVLFKGNVFFKKEPLSNVELKILQLSRSIHTNEYGMFSTEIDSSELTFPVQVQFVSDKKNVDSIISFNRSNFFKSHSIDLNKPSSRPFIPRINPPIIIQPLKEFCVRCSQFDASNKVITTRRKCSVSKKEVENYVSNFKSSAEAHGRRVECIWE